MWPSVRKMVNVGTTMSQVLLKGGFTYISVNCFRDLFSS